MQSLRKTKEFELGLIKTSDDVLKVAIVENDIELNGYITNFYYEGFELIKNMLIANDERFNLIAKNKIKNI
jgi:hypothetical protein